MWSSHFSTNSYSFRKKKKTQSIKLNIAAVCSFCQSHVVLCSISHLCRPQFKTEILKMCPPALHPQPVASASPGNLMEMQILGLYPRPTRSETLRMGAI